MTQFFIFALLSLPFCDISDTDSSGSDITLPEVLTRTQHSHKLYAAAKTNAIPEGMTVMNIAGEIEVHPHISVNLPVWWCPWFVGKSHALRILLLQPEARWWPEAPGMGHFLGPHITQHGITSGMATSVTRIAIALSWGAGVTYGYLFNLPHNWGIELSIGAGWFTTEYDRFHNTCNGARIDSRRTSYWGIDHASVSVAYRFTL